MPGGTPARERTGQNRVESGKCTSTCRLAQVRSSLVVDDRFEIFVKLLFSWAKIPCVRKFPYQTSRSEVMILGCPW